MKIFIVMSLFANLCFAGNRESGGRETANAVYVEFTSVGMGIDYASKSTYDNLLANAKMSGEVVSENSQYIGREGEVRVCVQLQNANQRYYFIQSLAGSINNDRQSQGLIRTHVFVGMNCISFENATEQAL